MFSEHLYIFRIEHNKSLPILLLSLFKLLECKLPVDENKNRVIKLFCKNCIGVY